MAFSVYENGLLIITYFSRSQKTLFINVLELNVLDLDFMGYARFFPDADCSFRPRIAAGVADDFLPIGIRIRIG